jgi:hypothetical protein
VNADKLGIALVAFVAGASAIHGAASYAKYRRSHHLKTPIPTEPGGAAEAPPPVEPVATVPTPPSDMEGPQA